MREDRIVFAQLMAFLPRYEFEKCVARYHGNRHVRSLSCYEQFLMMAFAQMTFRESLRDIETCLRSFQASLYRSGFRSRCARSTLADANEKRDWRIFADFAQALIAEAGRLYAGEEFGAQLDQMAFALDSTTIDVCLALFPWARLRHQQAALKLHTLLALQGNIPAVIIITPARLHDVNILDELFFVAGAFYIMDRAYLDFGRLRRLHESKAWFVTRARKNFCFRRRYSRPVDKTTGVRFDQTVVLDEFRTKKRYVELLRRIGYRDVESGKTFVFLTNNFSEEALTICRLYHSRWQIELFFKWIKQHLRIKAFYGTSANAVKTQVWVAISVYVLVAIIKKRLHVPHSLYTILQILSLTLFEKTPISQVFSQHPLPPENLDTQNQLYLQGFLTGQ